MKSFRNVNLIIRSINFSIVAMLMLVFGFTACVESEWTPYKSGASLPNSVITYQTTILSGKTKGDPAYMWRAKVVSGAEFCSIVKSVGAVGEDFQVRFEMNNSESERSAEVEIDFTDGYTASFTIRQLAKTKDPDYDHTWGEQPSFKSGDNLAHKTYYTTLNDKRRVRNYSICYDLDKVCSRWVAYPAHNIYTSGRDYQVGGTTAGRTNAWAFDDAVTQYKSSSNWSTAYEIVSTYVADLDAYNTYTNPIIPQKKQANIVGSNGFGYGYARGHMLPSADRYNTWDTNAQTCYATNIMVQDYDFNSASWGTLENKVRTKVCADTLFVVVGTLFEKSNTISKNGRTISVPSHCFKMLLRTKNGNTRKNILDIKSSDELMCIGFIFENNATGANTSLSNAATTVAEIERRSGFTFFRNLHPSIADKVKSQCNFSEWNF